MAMLAGRAHFARPESEVGLLPVGPASCVSYLGKTPGIEVPTLDCELAPPQTPSTPQSRNSLQSPAKVLEGLDDWEVSSDELQVGTVIGAGATCKVYSGTWQGMSVAVKEMHGKMRSMTQKARESLSRELAILQSVQHENVLRMYGVVPYRPIRIVTELCPGGSCFELLHEAPDVELAWAQKVTMCEQIASAMSYLHSFDPPIIHRDLKSLNILLLRPVLTSDDEPHVKISDFGLSRLRSMTRAGFMTQAVGTVQWMAPELLRSGDYDEHVDVYGYAMTVFEVVCRRVPFDEIDSDQEVADFIGEGGRPDLRLAPEGCPKILHSLLKLCWHQDPGNRPDFDHILRYLGMLRPELGLPPRET